MEGRILEDFEGLEAVVELASDLEEEEEDFSQYTLWLEPLVEGMLLDDTQKLWYMR